MSEAINTAQFFFFLEGRWFLLELLDMGKALTGGLTFDDDALGLLKFCFPIFESNLLLLCHFFMFSLWLINNQINDKDDCYHMRGARLWWSSFVLETFLRQIEML